jgi:hypothetical protein
MLRRLSTGFSVLSILIDINVSSVAVESHAAELHGSTVYGVVSWHDHGFLLFHNTTLCSGSADSLLECACREGTRHGTGRS